MSVDDLSRPLEPFEAMLSSGFINIVVRIGEGSAAVTKDAVEAATREASKVHPWLRTHLKRPTDPAAPLGWKFAPLADPAPAAPVTETTVELSALSEWHDRFMSVNNARRDVTVSNLFIHLTKAMDEEDKGTKVAELYFSYNHAGSDLGGVVQITHTILLILGGVQSAEDTKPRKFYNAVKMLPNDKVTEAPLPHALSDGRGDTEYIPHPKAPNDFGPLDKAQVRATHRTLNADATATLLRRAKEKGASIQSILSIAVFTACATLKRDLLAAGNEAMALGMVVHDLRPLTEPPLQDADCVFAGPSIWWQQPMKSFDRLWDLCVDCRQRYTAEIRERRAPYSFYKLMVTDPSKFRMGTMYATTLSRNPIQGSYGGLKLLETDGFHATVGTNEILAPMAAMSLHGYSAYGRLSFGIGYHSPAYPDDMINGLGDHVLHVLQLLASDDAASADAATVATVVPT